MTDSKVCGVHIWRASRKIYDAAAWVHRGQQRHDCTTKSPFNTPGELRPIDLSVASIEKDLIKRPPPIKVHRLRMGARLDGETRPECSPMGSKVT